MSQKQSYPFDELSPEEFERLCVDLLVAAYSDLSLSTAESPKWIDAIGTRNTPRGAHSVAVEVKHRSTFIPDVWRLFINRLSERDRKFGEYIFIPSSPIQDGPLQETKTRAAKTLKAEILLLGRADVIILLNRFPVIAAKYFKNVWDRVRRRKVTSGIGVIAATLSVGGISSGLHSMFGLKPESKSQLSEQVKSVEDSLARLNDLELGLKALKVELQQKSDQTSRVTKEYDEAMKLKTLTTDQLNEVKKAVGFRGGMDILRDYFSGLFLGVAGSVLATVITDKWKRQRALSKPVE